MLASGYIKRLPQTKAGLVVGSEYTLQVAV